MLRLTQLFHLVPFRSSQSLLLNYPSIGCLKSICCLNSIGCLIYYIYTIGIQITYKNMICITSTICYYLLLKSIMIHSYMKLHGVSKSMEVPLVIIHRWIFHLINHPFFGGTCICKKKKNMSQR